jgi:nicotinamidase-related amidase
MSPLVLAAERSQFLLVDLQERLVPAVADGARIVSQARILVEAARQLAVPVTVSAQYPKGLGPVVPELAAELADAPRFEKLAFSCLADGPLSEHLALVRRQGRHQLVIAGVEAHVCVLQSALEAVDRGYDAFVVADAVSSRSDRSLEVGLRRIERAGVALVTTEMVIFEWLGRAGSEAFKSLSRLIR